MHIVFFYLNLNTFWRYQVVNVISPLRRQWYWYRYWLFNGVSIKWPWRDLHYWECQSFARDQNQLNIELQSKIGTLWIHHVRHSFADLRCDWSSQKWWPSTSPYQWRTQGGVGGRIPLLFAPLNRNSRSLCLAH